MSDDTEMQSIEEKEMKKMRDGWRWKIESVRHNNERDQIDRQIHK